VDAGGDRRDERDIAPVARIQGLDKIALVAEEDAWRHYLLRGSRRPLVLEAEHGGRMAVLCWIRRLTGSAAKTMVRCARSTRADGGRLQFGVVVGKAGLPQSALLRGVKQGGGAVTENE
jgi:hypothetical protein